MVAAAVVTASAAATPLSARAGAQAQTDRRVSRRMALGCVVTITGEGRLIDGRSGDVSEGGMRVFARAAPPPGSRISLAFFLEGGLVAADGVVSWSAPAPAGTAGTHTAFGVRFDLLEDDSRALIAAHCVQS